MGRQRGGVIVDERLEPVEIHIDRAHVLAWSVEDRPVTLAAADAEQHPLAFRGICRNLEAPFAGTVVGGEASEISNHIRNLCVADLAFDEGRHDAPGLADGVRELRDRELAAGQIGPERALPFVAVAIAALRSRPVPERLAGLGISLRERRSLAERK